MSELHVGYKKCRNGIIVELNILGKTNEDRVDIVNPKLAKMRSSKVGVTKIYEVCYNENGERYEVEHDKAVSLYTIHFEYHVGDIIREPNFDFNLDKVCTSGIHYFLTEKAALAFDFDGHPPKNGRHVTWHDNGVIREIGFYLNGRRHGKYRSWYNNGQSYISCDYDNGEYHGNFKSWYKNGDQMDNVDYNNVKRDGCGRSYLEVAREGLEEC